MALHWFTDEDGIERETFLDLHKCTKEELNEFYPVASDSQEAIQKITEDPKRGLLCIDWTDDLYLQGTYSDERFSTIDIVMLPCNYIHTNLGFKDDKVSDKCNPDLKA